MDIVKDFEKLQLLKDELATSVTAKTFITSHQDELLSLLGNNFSEITKPTRATLIQIIETTLQKYAKQRAGFTAGDILPLKSVQERKRKEELARSNYLVPNLELACSPPEFYFRRNFDKKVSQSDMIDYVVIDPASIPEGFLEKFHIDYIDADCKNIKDIFKKSQPLKYHKEKQETTWRVVFIDGKIVVFRTLQQLLHKEEGLTAGEKRRVDYKKYFNAYDDVYAALRSQKYVVDKEEDKIDDYKDVQLQMIALLQDLKIETKHFDEKRKLDDIITTIRGATSFLVMASKFYDVYKINFMNKNIDAHRLEGAGNKISKELNKLYHIILEIKLQSDALEKIIYDQEYALKMFHAKVSKSVVSQHSPGFLSAFEEYYRYVSRIEQKTEPFIAFGQQITQVFGSVDSIAYMNPKEAFLKAEILIALQRILFQAYKLEHKIKLGEFKKRDAEFSPPIMKKHTEVYDKIFKDIDVLLKQIKTCVEAPTPTSLEAGCIVLEHMKQLPRAEKISLLQSMKVK